VAPFERGPGFGAENALDLFRAGQGHEQRLRKTQPDPPGTVDNLDRDNLRFIGADL